MLEWLKGPGGPIVLLTVIVIGAFGYAFAILIAGRSADDAAPAWTVIQGIAMVVVTLLGPAARRLMGGR